MAIMLIFELTLDYEVILPLMLACVVAYHVARTSKCLESTAKHCGERADGSLIRHCDACELAI